MKKVFIDTNIAIDLLCERYPWFDDALRLFSLADKGMMELYCSSLSLATASYIMETRKLSSKEIKESLDLFCQICTPTRVDAEVVQQAIRSPFDDFEDALQYFSALTRKADVIITRNGKDFIYSKLPVMTAEQYLASLQ
ncbi:MAG: PIN domain-containing protein [Paludibacteraceae bacterium]|nr:PIN domain-containing protein [Paludibacteraceae bacterium]